MKRLIKRYVRQRIALSLFHYGEGTMKRCADFVFNAPIWQWRLRLKIALNFLHYFPEQDLEKLLCFIRGER